MDLSKLGRTEQVLSSAGLLLFILSFLPWFSASSGYYSGTADAWSWPSGFNDWFPMLLLFFYAIVLMLPAFGVVVAVPILARPTNRAFIGLVLCAFAVLMFAIQGLTYPGGGFGYSAGPSWAYYLSLLIVLGAGVQCYLGFTQQGGSFAQVGAAFQARTQAVQQQQQQAPYGGGQAPQQPPYGGGQVPPQPPYGGGGGGGNQVPQPPYGGQAPQQAPHQAPYGQAPQQPPYPPQGGAAPYPPQGGQYPPQQPQQPPQQPPYGS
jgi:hypothetical protein